MSTVPHLPEALRKTLYPRRSRPGSAVSLTEPSARRLLAKIALALEKRVYDGNPHAAVYAAGTPSADPALREIQERALALLADPSVEAIRGAEIETLAAADTFLLRAARDIHLLAAIVVYRGLADAVRVLHRATFYGLAASAGGWTTAVWLTTKTDFDDRWISRWLPVRHAVCAADPAAYLEAVEVARAFRQGLDLLRRAQLAFVFPDEPWANEDLAASHAADLGAISLPTSSSAQNTHVVREPVRCRFLLSAATDPGVIRAQLARSASLPEFALELTQVLPASDFLALSAEALPGLLKKPKHGPLLKTAPRMVAQAVACFRTKEAASVLAPYASNAILAPIVLGFFRDAPELPASGVEGKGAAAVQRGRGTVKRRAEHSGASLLRAPAKGNQERYHCKYRHGRTTGIQPRRSRRAPRAIDGIVEWRFLSSQAYKLFGPSLRPAVLRVALPHRAIERARGAFGGAPTRASGKGLARARRRGAGLGVEPGGMHRQDKCGRRCHEEGKRSEFDKRSHGPATARTKPSAGCGTCGVFDVPIGRVRRNRDGSITRP